MNVWVPTWLVMTIATMVVVLGFLQTIRWALVFIEWVYKRTHR